MLMGRVHVPGPYAPLGDRACQVCRDPDDDDGDEGDDAVLTVIVITFSGSAAHLCVENGRSRDSAFVSPQSHHSEPSGLC